MITTPPLNLHAPITPFLPPEDAIRCSRDADQELGAMALYDPAGGLRQAVWQCRMDGPYATLQRLPDGPITRELTLSVTVTEISLAFDSSMRPYFAYREADNLKLYWYNTQTESNETLVIPTATSPRLCLDDKRPRQDASRDVLLYYLRAGALYVRQQRDRFAIEHLCVTTLAHALGQVGMAKGNRVQVELIVASCD